MENNKYYSKKQNRRLFMNQVKCNSNSSLNFNSYFMSDSHCENLRVLVSDGQLINFTQKPTTYTLNTHPSDFYKKNRTFIY